MALLGKHLDGVIPPQARRTVPRPFTGLASSEQRKSACNARSSLYSEPSRRAPTPTSATGRASSSSLVEFVPPRAWGGSTSWLADTVPAIVRECRTSKAPFLHLVSSRLHNRSQRLSVPAVVSDQVWSSLQSDMASSGVEALVLVRPLAGPHLEEECSSSNRCVASGLIGETCCAGDQGQGAPSTHGDHGHHHHHQDHHHDQHSSSTPAPQSAYYGLVVQGTGNVPRRHMLGSAPVQASCYILKMSASAESTGCSCVHYSLTRVHQGQPLWEQVMDSWRA